ncbi:LacI family DNA-binding transcriptional regulator [Deinococcus hopiensis]|uniref:Transcriptional regulator, LacI family n=1 Tax=Deinococcus hopiensis KR-140 TaxID=695939 RepID=A0A1W1VPA0_9DEIO|nr:LacI family DNA-binding transcriptional regulator [Deinococcus hopiensis]SMB94891.1 transcriptional regulator, LacI family [Deinococcus hopiensis KR-140]
MSKRRVTVIEVAREAGVSPATVSRILNGTAAVDPEKQRAVEKAIEQLGYRPNVVARGLVTGSSNIIGVLTPDLASPYYSDVLGGIEEALEGTPYSPLIASGHWNRRDELGVLDVLLSHQIAALIVFGSSLSEADLRGLAAGVPLVVLGRRVELGDLGGASISFDDEGGAYAATRHLVEQGHRVIGHIMGDEAHEDAHERLRGYRRALEEAGLPFDGALVTRGDYRVPSGLLGMQRLLDGGKPLTAVFCANDQMAIGARLALYRRGMRVPDDLSLVGFDDQPGSPYTTPPLTSVRLPMREAGLALARFALARLRGETPTVQVPSLELVVRESVVRRR